MNVETFLSHHGVKGMKWGVRKDEDSSGSSSLASQVKSLKDKFRREGPEGAVARLAEPDEADKGWRPTKKQVALVGTAAGAAFIGYYLYKNKFGNTNTIQKFNEEYGTFAELAGNFKGYEPHSLAAYKAEIESFKPLPANVKQFAGQKVSAAKYKELCHGSWDRSGFEITDYNFNIPGQIIPEGHEFYRLSTAAEKTFSNKTYMTPSKEDLSRYVASFKQEGYVIKFKSTSAIRTPDLKERLDALHTVLSRVKGKSVEPGEVLREYERLTFDKFGDTKLANGLFNELRARGFSAMIDDNNVGLIGEAPMILFDSSSVSGKSATKLNFVLKRSLLNQLTEMKNRK